MKMNQILKIGIFVLIVIGSFLIFPKISRACMCAKIDWANCPGFDFCAIGNNLGWICGILKDTKCAASCTPFQGMNPGCFGNSDESNCSYCAGGNQNSCNDEDFNCLTGGCPNEPGYEGHTCMIDADDEHGWCRNPKRGKWDPDERMCIGECEGPIQKKRLADGNQICYHATSDEMGFTKWVEEPCASTISHTCETACDPSVPPQCDEKLPGSPGCDANCHGISLCGNGQLDPGEDCDIGPDKIPGTADDIDDNCKGKCQADCKCPAAPPPGPCPTGPTYTCPPEIKCPTCPEELRGGLVPCDRSCDDPCTAECECAPCTLCHLFVLAKRIIDFLTLNILFPLAVLMIVIGGVMFLTAAGDPGRIGTAKKILTSVVIGLVIIFLAWLIVDTIIMFITKSGSPFQNWTTIDCPVP
jgi:hypothetical protein